jgi:hypothetical protein
MPRAFRSGLDGMGLGYPKWGRHGFDGIVCGREACRGVGTRNRLQKHNC